MNIAISSITTRSSAPWLILVSRSALFLAFQMLIAGLFLAVGQPNSWTESARWWPIVHALMDISTLSVYWMV